MGSSLHNKIYLGRSALRSHLALRGALAGTVLLSIAGAWLVLHALK